MIVKFPDESRISDMLGDSVLRCKRKKEIGDGIRQ